MEQRRSWSAAGKAGFPHRGSFPNSVILILRAQSGGHQKEASTQGITTTKPKLMLWFAVSVLHRCVWYQQQSDCSLAGGTVAQKGSDRPKLAEITDEKGFWCQFLSSFWTSDCLSKNRKIIWSYIPVLQICCETQMKELCSWESHLISLKKKYNSIIYSVLRVFDGLTRNLVSTWNGSSVRTETLQEIRKTETQDSI